MTIQPGSDMLILSFDKGAYQQWCIAVEGNRSAALKIQQNINHAQIHGASMMGSDNDYHILCSYPMVRYDTPNLLVIDFSSNDQSRILKAAEILAEQAGLKLEII